MGPCIMFCFLFGIMLPSLLTNTPCVGVNIWWTDLWIIRFLMTFATRLPMEVTKGWILNRGMLFYSSWRALCTFYNRWLASWLMMTLMDPTSAQLVQTSCWPCLSVDRIPAQMVKHCVTLVLFSINTYRKKRDDCVNVGLYCFQGPGWGNICHLGFLELLSNALYSQGHTTPNHDRTTTKGHCGFWQIWLHLCHLHLKGSFVTSVSLVTFSE